MINTATFSQNNYKILSVAATLGGLIGFSVDEALDKYLHQKSSANQLLINEQNYDYSVVSVASSNTALPVNAEITSAVGFGDNISINPLDALLNDFWSSLNSGALFDSMTEDVWSIAQSITENNQGITKFL